MPDLPLVAIGVITFNRPGEIRQTLAALTQHLDYAGPLRVIVADDSSPGDYLPALAAWWREAGNGWPLTAISTARNGGWGVNANHLLDVAFNQARTRYLFQIEDDYLLRRPLDLTVGVALLEQEPQLGMLRYRATAGAPMLYAQRETDISRWLPDYREHHGYTLGRITWLELLPQSPTLWLYSNGAHLKRFEFHGIYGKYPERLKLGVTEESYAHIVKDGMLTHPNTPKIGVLPEWIHMHFDHVGVSYQGTAYDR